MRSGGGASDAWVSVYGRVRGGWDAGCEAVRAADHARIVVAGKEGQSCSCVKPNPREAQRTSTQQDVFAFQVAVHDPAGVAVVDRFDQLPEQPLSNAVGERAVGVDVLEEVTACRQLGDEEEAVGVFDRFMELDLSKGRPNIGVFRIGGKGRTKK